MTALRRLIILEDPDKHREVIPKGETLEIGRAPGQGLFIPDRTVSRRHAVIRKRQGELLLEDLGSTFGTLVNGSPVPPGTSVALKDGDVIELGKVQIVCRIEAKEGGQQGSTRDAVFAAQANARLLVQEGQGVRRWPLAGAVTLLGHAPHCEVRLEDPTGPPELAVLRAQAGAFLLEPRSTAGPLRLNEDQTPVQGATRLESNSVFLLSSAQALFLYDLEEDGRPVRDALVERFRGRFLRYLCRKTGIARGRLKDLSRSYSARGQKLGEILVSEGLVTPIFWRALCARWLEEEKGTRGWFRFFL